MARYFLVTLKVGVNEDDTKEEIQEELEKILESHDLTSTVEEIEEFSQ